MNLEKGNVIPSFYWEEEKEHDVAIEGTPLQLKGRVPYFPISIGGTKEVLHLNRLDSIKEDYIIESTFLHKVSPIIVDETKMNFSCTINGRRISTPLYYSASLKCKNHVHRYTIQIQCANQMCIFITFRFGPVGSDPYYF